MRYGFIFPGGDPRMLAELSHEAEAAGWDGVFIPDCIAIDTPDHPALPAYDPWVTLAAMAMRTERVRIGAIVTPVSRRRPWKLARETVTLDHLSNGRLIVAVGLGALDDKGFANVGEATDLKTRAAMLDEGLEILADAWSGQRFRFHGAHYRVDDLVFLPPPVQIPRIPVWVVGAWPRPKSMQRTLRWDGILPQKSGGNSPEMTPTDIAAMKAFIDAERSQATPFDIVSEGETPGDDRERAAAIVRPFADAGATWWMETRWLGNNTPDELRARLRQGPPRSAD
ncbi:MAG: LLM class flavin-dependent oxidoreductase [Chloroflexota bacterium]|nr:LLM class flavin-dependent oxidoreductase [Chloroflexota bacterium]